MFEGGTFPQISIIFKMNLSVVLLLKYIEGDRNTKGLSR